MCGPELLSKDCGTEPLMFVAAHYLRRLSELLSLERLYGRECVPVLPDRRLVYRHDGLVKVDHLPTLEIATQVVEVPGRWRLSALEVG